MHLLKGCGLLNLRAGGTQQLQPGCSGLNEKALCVWQQPGPSLMGESVSMFKIVFRNILSHEGLELGLGG